MGSGQYNSPVQLIQKYRAWFWFFVNRYHTYRKQKIFVAVTLQQEKSHQYPVTH